jgi:hypothetical protein
MMRFWCKIFGHRYILCEGLGLIGAPRCARCGHRPALPHFEKLRKLR